MDKNRGKEIENFLKKEGFKEIEIAKKSASWYKKASEHTSCAKNTREKRNRTVKPATK